jgi:kinesin family protein 5
VTQQRVYVATAKRILVKVLKGYNGTIFTYGQTGSGKTHTMLGDDKDPGIIPRVGKDLMAEIKRMAGKTAFKVQASFVEIYREKIADLIAGVNDKQIQHDKDRNSQSSVLKAVSKMRRKSV